MERLKDLAIATGITVGALAVGGEVSSLDTEPQRHIVTVESERPADQKDETKDIFTNPIVVASTATSLAVIALGGAIHAARPKKHRSS